MLAGSSRAATLPSVVERPVAASGVVIEDLDDDICLYRPVDDEVVVLNRSAADVWRLADGTRTVPQILQQLVVLYEVVADDVRSDVHAVIDDLVARGFLVDASSVESS